MTKFVVTAIALVSMQAGASGLLAPFALDSAQVMPKGVRSLRVAGFSTSIGDKFDGGGTILPLAADLNKPITVKQLVDSQPKGFARAQMLGALKADGFNAGDVVGTSNGVADARITTTAPVVAWGATDKLTLAIAVPVVYTNLNVSAGWTSNSEMQAIVNDLAASGSSAKIIQQESALQNVVATKLAQLGYKPLISETHTDLGDVTLLAKYQLAKGDRYAWALQPRVSLPTGRTSDPDKVIDLAPGDGHVNVGLGTSVDLVATRKLIFTTGVGYTYQLAKTTTKRLPNSWDDTLSSDEDPNTREKDGDIMAGAVGARWQVHPAITLGAQYTYEYKLADQYSGGEFESDRYGYLAKDSQQRLQAAEISVSFSSVDAFLKKKFIAPLELNLGFTGVLNAQNVAAANLTSLELVSYF